MNTQTELLDTKRVRTRWDRVRVSKAPGGDSLTKQSFKDEADINRIMAKYEKGQLITHVNTFQGRYEDLTGVQDYKTSMDQIIEANNAFNSMPARLRAEFNNDPAQFLTFVDDPSNEDRMRELGLLPPKAPPPNEEPPSDPPATNREPEVE